MASRRLVLQAGLLLGLAGCTESKPALPIEPHSFPRPQDTFELFRPGSLHRLSTGETATASVRQAGFLRLPTGRLIAADPSWVADAERLRVVAYTVSVKPGRYPLTLALAGPLVAAARLTVADEPIDRWEMAVRPGEDPATLAPGEAFNVGVDTGTILMFDAAALPAFVLRSDRESGFAEVPDERPVEVTDPASGANGIAFHSGMGDGGYPVWIGRTRSGGVGCFLVDLALLPAT